MRMSDMRIGIVGGGVVGLATAKSYLEHVKQVLIYDIDYRRATTSLIHLLAASDIVFICLPTPSKKDGACDTSAIDNFFRDMPRQNRNSQNFVIKSTVPIGLTKTLSGWVSYLVHSPEFLTARCAMSDALLPTRNIIGTPPYGSAHNTKLLLASLYEERFPGVQTILTTSCESEAIKLFTNAFFATKIGFFNEIHSLAKVLELDWARILKGMLSDGRISHSHTQVPGPDGKYGFGGACLPKDLENLMDCFKEAGLTSEILATVNARNAIIDRIG